MATLSENLQTLSNLKSSLKNTLINKGFDTTTTPFTSYPNLVQAMEKSVTRESLTVSPSTSEQTFMPTLGSLYSQVTVQSAPLQDLSITENGTYSADAGYYGIRSINVDVAGSGEDTLGQMIMGSLSQYTAPSFVTRIASYAFYVEMGLKSARFPYVMSIGTQAFSQCQIENLYFDRITSLSNVSNALQLKFISAPNVTILRPYALQSCQQLKSFIFSNLTSIGDYAFYGAATTNVSDVDAWNLYLSNLTTLGSYAFAQCRLLKTISIPNISSLLGYCFQGANRLTNIYGSFTSIGSGCFAGTALSEASFPNITILLSYTFSQCSALKNVYLPNVSLLSGTGIFSSCVNLSSIELLSLVSINGSSVFASCSALKTINFPSLVYMSGNSIFYSCSNLETIDIHNVSILPQMTFMNCLKLPELYLSVASNIFSSCFYRCESLSALALYSTSFVSLSNTNAFTFTPMSLSSYLGYFGSIYVPDSMVASYKTRANWSIYSNRITGLSNLPVEITVNVKDSNNNPMQFISVNFNNGTDFNVSKGADNNGQIKIKLPVGVYTLTADSLEGWSSPQAQSLTVVSQTPQTINLTYTLTQQNPVAYGVKIDLNNSDPETSVSYIDDAVGFSKSYMDFDNDQFVYGSWADKFPYNQIKPCLIKNGAVYKYLNPNNYAQDVDGNAVDITTGADGEVFVEFPKFYYALHKDENYQYVEISNYQKNGSFDCLAHRYKNVEHNKAYISAYPVGNSYNVMTNSLSGITLDLHNSSQSLTTARNLLESNGFEPMTYNLHNMILCLYIIQFKNLKISDCFDYWNDENPLRHKVGGGDNKGLFYGTLSPEYKANKFYGLENYNHRSAADGIKTLPRTYDSVYSVINTLDENCVYNTNGVGYIQKDFVVGGNQYIKEILGNKFVGFLFDTAGGNGSSDSYYCGYASYSSSSTLILVGNSARSIFGYSFTNDNGVGYSCHRKTLLI